MSQDNNSDDDDFCPFPRCLQDGASYCAGDSLSTIIIMRCPTDNSTTGGATGACPQPANCKAKLVMSLYHAIFCLGILFRTRLCCTGYLITNTEMDGKNGVLT